MACCHGTSLYVIAPLTPARVLLITMGRRRVLLEMGEGIQMDRLIHKSTPPPLSPEKGTCHPMTTVTR